MLNLPTPVKAAFTLLLAIGLIGAAAPLAANADTTPPVCSATPFRANPAANVYYRIPVLVKTTHNTLVAFAERRTSSDPSSDTGNNDLVVSRSTDAGCSWSQVQVIGDDGTNTVGNPSAVVDQQTGNVLVFTVDRPQGGTSWHGFHEQVSTDDGVSFTPYSAAGKDLYKIPGWMGGLTGPGHAIQLQAGPHAGRIILPMTYYTASGSGAYGLLSDDHGATWRVGYKSFGTDGRMEGTATVLGNGNIWLSYHDWNSGAPVGQNRVAAVSADDGESLTGPFTRLALPTISVYSSAITLTGTHAGEVLVSSPGLQDITQRKDMTIFTSLTATPGSQWATYPVTLDDTPASYSDMVQLNDSQIGILYETGITSWHEGIVYHTVPIVNLTAGQATSSKLIVHAPQRGAAHRTYIVDARAVVPGVSSPAGNIRITLVGLGHNHYRSTQILRIYQAGGGRRVGFFNNLPRGSYSLWVTYTGSPRIKQAHWSTKNIQVR